MRTSRLHIIKVLVTAAFALGVLAVYSGSLFSPVRASASDKSISANLPWRLPQGIPEHLWRKLIPADNPLNAEKVALGQALYFDKRLSIDGTVSCATCHDPATAFANQDSLAIGINGSVGTRNAPTVLNAMFNSQQFWDGRVASLEDQARQPLINPAEMGMKDYTAVVERVSAITEYRQQFRKAFGSVGITIDTIVKAIAAFERTQLSGNSPFDRFIGGDESSLTDAQKRGWVLFRGKAQCIECHSFDASTSPFFTDFKSHNTGIATRNQNFPELIRRIQQINERPPQRDQVLNMLSHTDGFSEVGRYLVTKQPQDLGAFKTPTLRDIELTPPYMHNGSEKTLLDVIRFYNHGGEPNPTIDARMRPLKLSDIEMNDLVEFLRALTSDDVLRQAQSRAPQTRAAVPLPISR